MKSLAFYISKNKYRLILGFLIFVYIAYFATFSILRYKHLYSQYFDLGIMHQTVYNSYQALRTGNMSRILELTDPHGGHSQIKRMAIHNDMILAFLSPFYFLYSGPETILVLQTVVLALGALFVYKISQNLLKKPYISVSLAFSYLMYSSMQRANIFEFHAVTFATTCILAMFYFWIKKNLKMSFLFLILTLLTKEEVGLTLGMFGIYAEFLEIIAIRKNGFHWKHFIFPILVTMVSWSWSMISVYWIIPFFNGGEHFATGYYSNVRETFMQSIFSLDTFWYIFYLVGPIGFLSLIAPEFILIAAPEFAINLLSSNLQLRSLDFHYTSAIQPWLFIGAIYGVYRILHIRNRFIPGVIAIGIISASIIFNYLKGPLPYSPDKVVDPWLYDRAGEYTVIKRWADRLSNDSIKVSSTDEIGPFFTSRRYFYIFSDNYKYADYVIVSTGNLQYTYRKDVELPAYETLKRDPHFIRVDEENGYEVYKKMY